MQRLVLLGTGTCQLEVQRKASSVLVELEGLRILYDLGRGIADRLVEVGSRQDDLEHIVLSHFHPDHLSDLIPYLHAACWSQVDPRSRDLHIHGPVGLRVQMMRLLSLFGPDTLQRHDRFQIHLHEHRGEVLNLGGRTFQWVDLPPADNHGLRFEVGGKVYVLTGDAGFGDPLVKCLTGVDVAVIDSGHSTDAEIVELAVRSGAQRILCSHLYRPIDGPGLTAEARGRGYAGVIDVAEDLEVLEL